MECPNCGWMGNQIHCPDCGAKCMWDEDMADHMDHDEYVEDTEEEEE